MKTADIAVCYVTDSNYLLPTLVAASSARRWMGPGDIFIFTLNVPAEIQERCEASPALAGIHLVPMAPEILPGFAREKFAQTHVSIGTLGRIFLADYLPPKYERILYLDGDTWVVGELSGLIAHQPPDGVLAAAEDALDFYCRNAGPMGAAARKYLSGLRIDGATGYFNAGVLLATRSAWRQIMSDALEFFRNNTDKCRYHDQSALNAVAMSRRVALSPKWNFQTPYRHWGVESFLRPHIYHFVGAAKPWMGKCEPWSGIHEAYMADFAPFAHLRLPLTTISQSEMSRIDAKERRNRERFGDIYFLRKRHYQIKMRGILARADLVQ